MGGGREVAIGNSLFENSQGGLAPDRDEAGRTGWLRFKSHSAGRLTRRPVTIRFPHRCPEVVLGSRVGCMGSPGQTRQNAPSRPRRHKFEMATVNMDL